MRALLKASGLSRWLAFALVGCLFGGCATTKIPGSNPRLLDFLIRQQTSSEEVLLKLGQPSATFENGSILTYRLGYDPKNGYFLREAGVENWLGIKYSLVLVFDAQRRLKELALVEVR